MKISEIRELYKGINEGEFTKVEIDIKKFTPLTSKIMVIEGYDFIDSEGVGQHVNGLVDNVTVEENGFLKINRFMYEMYLTFTILKNYTDIDFEDLEFTPDDYDMFMQSGLWDRILDTVEDYYKFVKLLDTIIDEKIQLHNSVSKVFKDGLDKGLSLISDLSDSKKLDAMLKTVNKAMKQNPELGKYMKAYVDMNGANK